MPMSFVVRVNMSRSFLLYERRIARSLSIGMDQLYRVRLRGSQDRITGKSIVTSVALSPNGRWIATGHQNGVVKLWKISRHSPSRRSGQLRRHSTLG